MIDCLREREKRDLSNRDYVYCQFTNKRLKTRYKNVFIHTSLIEGLIVDRSLRKESQVRQKCECCGREDSFRSFRRAIEILRDDVGDQYNSLHEIYTIRNELAHDFITLDQAPLEQKIEEAWEKIINVYKNSEFLNELFHVKYNFRPDKIVEDSTTSQTDT
ncbi:MAG: hypothetical protein A3C03_00205 [Candidatus Colwellbacteria bacterium RIFCSPHIGHO2_02_FULL_45_17]|uniref:Uncharacterized protein n=3 Tax=Parcubacteria group TaxID=1794811 RepID=A0A0H4T7I7_9BACT|nr:hypothetical protein [uncultured Parcubacteria bacterium Rifle_16ft_4_minimus_37647]OGY58145.1 MAG: hypothetical protein A3C03_00205 [Candidatus Colwellbacteria bacterium RIFCSPHIGHO2_02_FULL_45_17]OGY61670.1 MAG: hypothetical protein A3I33_01110 [Candidatus Colwellbacteria bacterium RIFCSPLOWO2_02_FULL_45_11]OGY62098.1 MAG: hypothetical protein A3G58_00785 [Candidatus Colwellbacteria bacterium RIFCSPLOWO2_12_FULL_46_17]